MDHHQEALGLPQKKQCSRSMLFFVVVALLGALTLIWHFAPKLLHPWQQQQVVQLHNRLDRLQPSQTDFFQPTNRHQQLLRLQEHVLAIESHYQLNHSATEAKYNLQQLVNLLVAYRDPSYQEFIDAIKDQVARLISHDRVPISQILMHSSALMTWLKQRQSQKKAQPLKSWGVDWSKWIHVRSTQGVLSTIDLLVIFSTLERLQWATLAGDQPVYHQAVMQLKSLTQLPEEMQKNLNFLIHARVDYPKIDFELLRKKLFILDENLPSPHKKIAKLPQKKLSAKAIEPTHVPVQDLLRQLRQHNTTREVM